MSDEFTMPKLPSVSDASLPRNIEGAPFAEQAAEYRRLRHAFDEAVEALHAIAAEGPDAAERDRHALAQAMAAGKADPGRKVSAKLAEKFTAQTRRATGLADATQAAYLELRHAIEQGADAWAAELEAKSAGAAERVDALLGELGDVLAAGDVTRNTRHWLQRAATLDHNRGLPSPSGGTVSVPVGGGLTLSREQVFAAIRGTI